MKNIPEAGRWTFESESIADEFDSHVKEQLPWYEMMTSAVCHVARHYIPKNGVVYDIGASTGNIGRSLKPDIESRCARLNAIEPSIEMSKKYTGGGELFVESALIHKYEKYDVAIVFLVLMFLSPLEQIQLIQKLKENLNLGGCIIIVDKTIPQSGYLSVVLTRLALLQKFENGVDANHILKKELSLMGVQRPIDVRLLKLSSEFFRFGDFAGYIIEG